MEAAKVIEKNKKIWKQLRKMWSWKYTEEKVKIQKWSNEGLKKKYRYDEKLCWKSQEESEKY